MSTPDHRTNEQRNAPAFPVAIEKVDRSGMRFVEHEFGLTKRELLAAMALQGLLAGSIVVEQDTPELTATIARTAVASADALLAALDGVTK
jgi:hypothetical protein